MPKEICRLAVVLLAIASMLESAVAKDKSASSTGRRPASLSALAAPGVTHARPDHTARKRGYRFIGSGRLPSGGATETLLVSEGPGGSENSSQLMAPRISLPRERTMPRQGTLSPQYNYTDVNIQFR